MGTPQEVLEVWAEHALEDIDALNFRITRERDKWTADALKLIRRQSPKRPAEQTRTVKRLARYRREATARRRKALTLWMECMTKIPETNPNATYG